jgi:hypothetical protein
MRLQVVADQAGSKHTGDSRNRDEGGQPVWPITTPDVEGMEMRTFGESEVRGAAWAETRFQFHTGLESLVGYRLPVSSFLRSNLIAWI